MVDFLIIGSQKCGTTWLFDKLKMHPRVYFPMGKEAHFWNKRFYLSQEYRNIYMNSMRGPVVDLCNYICGEVTPKYVIMSPEQIQTLWKHYPDVQLILMVRNPVQRAWSAIKMTYKYKQMDLSSVTDEVITTAIISGLTAELGRYDAIISNWLKFFKKEQLEVIFFDDLATRYRDILTKLCNLLTVDPDFFAQIPDVILSSPSLKGESFPLKPKIYNECLEFYKPSIKFLETYTRRDLISWLNPVESKV